MVWSSDASDLLIAQLIGDDPQQGFSLLLQQYGGRIRGYLRQRFPSLDPADLHDVITDAMLALGTSFDASRGTLPAWFLLLAHQQAVQLLRSRRAHLAHRGGEEDVQQLAGGADPLAALISAERVAQLQRAVASLPWLERSVVEADLDEGRGVAAEHLAERLDTTVGSIYAARKRARRKLIRACDWIRDFWQGEEGDHGKTGST